MGSSVGRDESEKPNKEVGKTTSGGGRRAREQPARRLRIYAERIGPQERRRRLFEQDALGRTFLFYAAEEGLEEEVKEMIYSLRGTGMGPPRLTLISTKDHSGLTAADVAEQSGHEGIARLLRGEQGRMEWFE